VRLIRVVHRGARMRWRGRHADISHDPRTNGADIVGYPASVEC
jgi:hypothetical protein